MPDMAAATLISAFRHRPPTPGKLTLLNQVECQGNNPVDSALDPTERFLVIANYGSGAVAVMPIGDDGRPAAGQSVGARCKAHPGPNPKEQSSSHPHAVIFDPSGQFVVVPDKGFDCTFLYRFKDGRLTPTGQGPVIASAPGAAPRHTTFHPTLPVLLREQRTRLTATVFDWKARTRRPNGR